MAGLYPMGDGTQMDELRAWLGLHGADPREVPITEDMTITTDDNGVQWLNWYQFALVNGQRYINVMGTGAAVEKHTARLAAPPPDWWEPIVHPTRDELLDQLAKAQAELAALREGEEPVDEAVHISTPGEWIYRWNRSSPQLRRLVADRYLQLQEREPVIEKVRTVLAAMDDAGDATTWAEQLHAALGQTPSLLDPVGQCWAELYVDDDGERFGSCWLQAGHGGPVHQTADGTTWPTAEHTTA